MLFSELYGVYYNTVAAILSDAVKGELCENKLQEIVCKKAFSESCLTIPQALKSGKWQLMTPDFKTPLRFSPEMPLTTLEKRWLKAISLDERIKLFEIDFSFLDGVSPLFTPDTIYYYDKYSDGDNYKDEAYVERFKIILSAIKSRSILKIVVQDKKGRTVRANVIPERLEYSQKDDKFRLITSGCRYRQIVKLADLRYCEICDEGKINPSVKMKKAKKTVGFLLFDGRKTLERAMLHFAHFEKRVEKLDSNHYFVNITYDVDDETEMVIRILSFGPFIKVTEPQSFVNLIKERLEKQKKCGI